MTLTIMKKKKKYMAMLKLNCCTTPQHMCAGNTTQRAVKLAAVFAGSTQSLCLIAAPLGAACPVSCLPPGIKTSTSRSFSQPCLHISQHAIHVSFWQWWFLNLHKCVQTLKTGLWNHNLYCESAWRGGEDGQRLQQQVEYIHPFLQPVSGKK